MDARLRLPGGSHAAQKACAQLVSDTCMRGQASQVI